jgi:poly-gamma-glutamate capsule biosynthesis protein CapA/YwtB (metallophosphatase superfamily)
MSQRNETRMTEHGAITLVAVGDVRPEREDAPSIFQYCGDVFRTADIVFGQMEGPLSDRGFPQFTPHAPIRLPAHNISALTEEGAGFDVMSFACNHAMDYGYDAFLDTLAILRKNGIAVVGAGADIWEARKPVIVERNGTKVGFLAYLSILSPGLEAGEGVPGCAPLRASHFYWQWDYQPGTPPIIVTDVFPEYRSAMEHDIKELRSQVDVLVVSIHAGVHFVPKMIAMYQKEAAHAAVDAGADLILQHHAHMLKGIEVYRGKVIFYSLGNFAFDPHIPRGPSRPLGDPFFDTGERYKRKPIAGYERYSVGDAMQTMVAKAYIRDKSIQKVTLLPAYIRPTREPEVLNREHPRAQQVFDYVDEISQAEYLNVAFSWDGNEIMISG